MVLAFLSVVGGFVGIPAIFAGEGGHLLANWLGPVFEPAHHIMEEHAHGSHTTEMILMALSVIGAVLAIMFARYIYLKKPSIAENTSKRFKGVYNLLYNKYKIDEVYEASFVRPIVRISESFLWKITDAKLIDGAVNGAASVVEVISKNIRKMQTGVTQFYAAIMMVGIILSLLLIILSL
jgi:NADH-quinone oxidoreductase subunit L